MNSRPNRYTAYSPFLLLHSRLPNGVPQVMKVAADSNQFNLGDWSQRLNYIYHYVIPQHCATKSKQKFKQIPYWHGQHHLDDGKLKLNQAFAKRKEKMNMKQILESIKQQQQEHDESDSDHDEQSDDQNKDESDDDEEYIDR